MIKRNRIVYDNLHNYTEVPKKSPRRKNSLNFLPLFLSFIIGLLVALFPTYFLLESYKKDIKEKDTKLNELETQLKSIAETISDQDGQLTEKNKEIDNLKNELGKYKDPFKLRKTDIESVDDLIPQIENNFYTVKVNKQELTCTDEEKEFLADLNYYAMLRKTSIDGRQDLKTPLTINSVPIVSKLHWVDESYAPGINSEAEDAYLQMQEEAAKEGITLVAFSIYRSYLDQKIVNDNWLKENKQAYRTSSMAGQSEHQTGLAFDINDRESNFMPSASTEWLANNAYKYGFNLRYPKDKEYITGYIYEPWHYRYVGKEIAKDFGPRNTLTLEEYFGLISRDILAKITTEIKLDLKTKLETLGK